MNPPPDISSKAERLEKKLFEIICLLAMGVFIHGIVEGLVLHDITPLIFIQLFISLALALFFYLSRYKGKFVQVRYLLIILLNMSQIFFWFWLGGLYGPAALGAAAVGMVTTLLLTGKWKIRFLLLFSFMMLVLVYLQIHTGWVRMSPYRDETLPYDYLVVLFSILLITYYLKSEFDKERRVVLQQNRELEFLNAELKKSVGEKEEIIKELKSTQRKLIESEKMASIGRLTAGIAHELNNPLNFIGGNILPIKRDVEDIRKSLNKELLNKNQLLFEEIDQLLENIQDGSNHANGVIENLLRIDPGSNGKIEKTIDLVDTIQRTCKLVQNTHPNIELSLVIRDQAVIYGNIVEINQVLLNVLKNAIDAVSISRGKKGKIVVTISRKDTRHCEVRVTDNGPGIPPKIRPKVFEPFYTTKKDEKGTGLGLYISYGILKKHGGTIHIDAKYKGGAQVLIRLPLLQQKRVRMFSPEAR